MGAGLALVFLFTAAQVLLPERSEQLVSTFTSSVLYKGKEPQGLFASRRTPWQRTVAVIDQHPWLGSGFGTSDIGLDGKSVEVSSIETREETAHEHGSSYLALVEWVGLLGGIPFALLFALILQKLGVTFAWIHKSGDPGHYSVPIALVLTSGLVHGLFEDWIVAVGYYLTILFWSFAFILMDLAPRRSSAPVQASKVWRAALQTPPGAVAIGP
jgi:O-antigen ligase